MFVQDFDVKAKVAVNEAKEFCQQRFSTRMKDRAKVAGDSKQASTTTVTTPSSSAAVKSLRCPQDAPLPPVRGSFQSFACDKAKRTKVVPSTLRKENTASTSTPANTSKPAAKADIPSSSWLNRAKDGSAALASMFTKPKKS